MRLDQSLGVRGYFFSFSEGNCKIKGHSTKMQALHFMYEATQAHRDNATTQGQSWISILKTRVIIISGNTATLCTWSVAPYV